MGRIEGYERALWVEHSGLPRELNGLRSGAWPVFRQLLFIASTSGGATASVEITLDELAERCGLELPALGGILETLRRKKYIRCYLPDEPAEPALIDIAVPIATPLSPAEIARRIEEPRLRDHTIWLFLEKEKQPEVDELKVRQVVDLYLNHLSQKMNSLVLDQIQLVARRFPLDRIREMIERAERHNLRNMGWVVKELIKAEIKERKPGK